MRALTFFFSVRFLSVQKSRFFSPCHRFWPWSILARAPSIKDQSWQKIMHNPMPCDAFRTIISVDPTGNILFVMNARLVSSLRNANERAFVSTMFPRDCSDDYLFDVGNEVFGRGDWQRSMLNHRYLNWPLKCVWREIFSPGWNVIKRLERNSTWHHQQAMSRHSRFVSNLALVNDRVAVIDEM